MQNRKHDRIFIMLEGTNGINGSCDIEIINGKCRLFCYVGGIKNSAELFLVSGDGKRISVGNLEPKGTNSTIENSFSPDNIFESGKAIEEISLAEIKNSDGQTLLSGSFPKRSKPEIPKPVEQPPVVSPENCEKPKPSDKFRKFIKEFRQELDDLDNIKVEIPEEKEVEKEPDIFTENTAVSLNDSINWVRTDLREAYIIKNAVDDLQKPFVRNCARKGRHILTGKSGNDYFLAVPADKTMKERAELNGFDKFMAVDENGDIGYWFKQIEA